MTKAFSKLEIIVLEWVSADYETVSSILANVSAYTGEDVSREQIVDTLGRLQERGLVDSFVYDRSAQRYEQRSVDLDGSAETYCWLATLAGRRIAGMEPDGP